MYLTIKVDKESRKLGASYNLTRLQLNMILRKAIKNKTVRERNGYTFVLFKDLALQYKKLEDNYYMLLTIEKN